MTLEEYKRYKQDNPNKGYSAYMRSLGDYNDVEDPEPIPPWEE